MVNNNEHIYIDACYLHCQYDDLPVVDRVPRRRNRITRCTNLVIYLSDGGLAPLYQNDLYAIMSFNWRFSEDSLKHMDK